ncbi:MAG: hypothetical protein JJ900_00980 [Rhodospirillales bacterium]|nr:hypothetical protein [Rhodospirillales bacterium]MBO6785392.1 hypothetical protein [Rhodospirillales bacterium]
MDLQTVCIVAILAAMIAMLVRAMLNAGKARTKVKKRAVSKPPPGAFALDDALDKLNETVRILQRDLGDQAPGRNDPGGLRFYIAYLVGVAREIAKMNKIAYGPALETPIRMEMIRHGISSSTGGDAMARLLASDEGQQGLIAGEMDGVDACDPNYDGPYFARILSYFTDAEVRGPR